jgi:hypothetical protein
MTEQNIKQDHFEPLLKAADVAMYLNCSRTEAYRLMRDSIPVIRFGKGTVRVKLHDLQEFIDGKRITYEQPTS